MPVEFNRARTTPRPYENRRPASAEAFRGSRSKRPIGLAAKLALTGVALFAGTGCVSQSSHRVTDAAGKEWLAVPRPTGKEWVGEGQFFASIPGIGALSRTAEEIGNGGLFGIFSLPVHLLGDVSGMLAMGYPGRGIIYPNVRYELVDTMNLPTQPRPLQAPPTPANTSAPQPGSQVQWKDYSGGKKN